MREGEASALDPLEYSAGWCWRGQYIDTITIGGARIEDYDEPYYASVMMSTEKESFEGRITAAANSLDRA